MASLNIVDGIRLGVTLWTSLLWKEDGLDGVAASIGYLFHPNPRKYWRCEKAFCWRNKIWKKI